MNNDRITGIKWLPFVLLIGGLILKWLHLDEQGIVLNIGFISFGLVILLDCIKAKYYKQFSVDTLKIILALVVIVLAIENLLAKSQTYTLFVIAALFHFLVGQGRRLILKKQ